MFFTESFAITPTTLALRGSKVGTVYLMFWKVLFRDQPGQWDQTCLQPLEEKCKQGEDF